MLKLPSYFVLHSVLHLKDASYSFGHEKLNLFKNIRGGWRIYFHCVSVGIRTTCRLFENFFLYYITPLTAFLLPGRATIYTAKKPLGNILLSVTFVSEFD